MLSAMQRWWKAANYLLIETPLKDILVNYVANIAFQRYGIK